MLDLAHLRRVAGDAVHARGNPHIDYIDARAREQRLTSACAPGTILALLDRLEAAERVLRDYEGWEGDIIMSADWQNETPRLTQSQWDKMMEIQAARNEALATHAALTREGGE